MNQPAIGVIQNNTFLSGNVNCILFPPGSVCLDTSGNTTPTTYWLGNFSATSDYKVKSSDGALTGVTDRNAPGSIFVVLTPITFIPVNATCSP